MRVLLCLLGLAMAVPAYAGHGTIEETDECFIVEWTGDASDKAPETKQKTQGTAGATSVQQRVAPAQQQVTPVSGGVEAKRGTPGAAVAEETATSRRNRRTRVVNTTGEETGNAAPRGRHD